MILIACTDDVELQSVADNSIWRDPQIFNRRYQLFRNVVPVLKAQENLFILARGAFESPEDGRPVIGDRSERSFFFIDGRMCYCCIRLIIPADYTGGIYVDACFSADSSPYIEPFITTLKRELVNNGQDIAVYGVNGDDSGLVVLPGDPRWKQAEILLE